MAKLVFTWGGVEPSQDKSVKAPTNIILLVNKYI